MIPEQQLRRMLDGDPLRGRLANAVRAAAEIQKIISLVPQLRGLLNAMIALGRTTFTTQADNRHANLAAHIQVQYEAALALEAGRGTDVSAFPAWADLPADAPIEPPVE